MILNIDGGDYTPPTISFIPSAPSIPPAPSLSPPPTPTTTQVIPMMQAALGPASFVASLLGIQSPIATMQKILASPESTVLQIIKSQSPSATQQRLETRLTGVPDLQTRLKETLSKYLPILVIGGIGIGIVALLLLKR